MNPWIALLILNFWGLLCVVNAKPSYTKSYDPRIVTDHEYEANIFPIDLRSLRDYSLSDYLLINRNTGNLLWTLPFDEPLIKIETNGSHSNADTNILWFVEPYNDGSLYYFTPEYGLNKLPASIKELVLQSPFFLSGDDKIYTGTRKTSLYTINVHTGELMGQYGDSEDSGPKPTTAYEYGQDDVDCIMIGKTVYELTIHSQSNSNVVWYVTYTQWGPNNIDNDLILQNQKSMDKLYFTPFHDRSLLAINQDLGTPIWISKLPSLTVNVFDIFNNPKSKNDFVTLPHPLKVLNNLQVNHDDTINDDLCFINRTANSKQWFAMSFENYPTLIKSAPIAHYQMSLFKADNDIRDLQDLYHLRYLDPVSKFKDILVDYGIDDGTTIYGLPETDTQGLVVHRTTTNLPFANIIEGIRFHTASKVDGKSFPTSHKEQNMFAIDQPEQLEYLPGPNSEEYHPYKVQHTRPSLFRRIIEDIAVLLSLLAVFVLGVRIMRRVFSNWKIEFVVNIDNINGLAGNATEEGELDPKLPPSGEKVTDNLNEGKKDGIVSKENGVTDSGSADSSEMQRLTLVDPIKAEDIEELAKKRQRKRGSRGGKRGNKSKKPEDNDELDELVFSETEELQIENDLIISDKILGYGSHGTVVFQGTFENRPVAVKRMLLDFYDVANHEVSLLQQSDDHPNVIRYFCSQSSVSEKFLYIALELCRGSLDDLIERPKISANFTHLKNLTLNYSDLLYQLTNGLNYLHNLKIVHRDLKPQNILIGEVKNKNNGKEQDNSDSNFRLLISDFGLCKRLDNDQSSFRATTQNAASGTSGWRAPELLLNHDLLEISPDTISSIGSNSPSNNNNSNSTGGIKRLTKAIDIFSLGCIFFYIMTKGNHPFGDRYMRDGNIVKGIYSLSLLDDCKDRYESKHLIASMIDQNPDKRPNTRDIMKHPFFWSKGKKLEFLLKVSDRFEIEKRDPPSPLLLELEKASRRITGGNWHVKFNDEFMSNLGKYRKYQPEKLMDLLRALRNKYHHFNDMPLTLQKKMSPLPNGFYDYFNSRFPNLVMEVYFVVERNLKKEHIFEEYY
ncbi:kinase-like protein [Yamadazyma tenuis ATCC 10573]|uniref:non-specific serine/threonine protein kinase n=1 Tax=Candida tenuis (strain ATCC 10573 / BCRC 21748 / CBS 615 / JCM 9827 / NBRC 10315 / NRRL Y-1498 / VKM Y-70) TaxID=590646 RepID=G3BE30_CANTC|nr:kinase-like protein [Yamadazyma tenuis ATCC 10573]EGV60443.1 kinase-like protein [Yamadazyma tenuis ATCC 10573]